MNCPQCDCEYTYEVSGLYTCPECAHEWFPGEETEIQQIVDSVGNPLSDGDSVTIVKTMKIKGSATPLKAGTKVKNIRLIEPENGHDIEARIDGFGKMYLKSSIVKKA
ncbi:zinc ribbon domain-containing protein YjdM [Corynebacterium choanae]|uniref:Alkylphosphonate utilization protein n=1 Tax=Corynebacterium choanae TaxID=1862358 RepID=A0A3G6J3Z4_9CORY|nr:zinc ribbon domain-containing protein YjdM [Corynebacterium choanae]AZA12649.1 hypothetical protein CCHOA_01105 [Corynebacterium choanae]